MKSRAGFNLFVSTGSQKPQLLREQAEQVERDPVIAIDYIPLHSMSIISISIHLQKYSERPSKELYYR
jgi:hypothetical protein